jgi:hypothetical protein
MKTLFYKRHQEKYSPGIKAQKIFLALLLMKPLARHPKARISPQFMMTDLSLKVRIILPWSR